MTTQIMRAFYDSPILSGSHIMREELDKTGNLELKISFNQMSLEEINHLRSQFSGKPYRLSLSYLVSPVRIPSSIEEEEQLVQVKDAEYRIKP